MKTMKKSVSLLLVVKSSSMQAVVITIMHATTA